MAKRRESNAKVMITVKEVMSVFIICGHTTINMNLPKVAGDKKCAQILVHSLCLMREKSNGSALMSKKISLEERVDGSSMVSQSFHTNIGTNTENLVILMVIALIQVNIAPTFTGMEREINHLLHMDLLAILGVMKFAQREWEIHGER